MLQITRNYEVVALGIISGFVMWGTTSATYMILGKNAPEFSFRNHRLADRACYFALGIIIGAAFVKKQAIDLKQCQRL